MILNRIYCAVHTRDEVGADTSDRSRVFLNGNMVAEFSQSMPAQGKVGILESDVFVDYEGFINGNLAIGITGADKWGPRSIFLWGTLDNGDLAPIAENLDCVPYSWVSQDLSQGTDRLPLKAISYQSDVNTASYNPYTSVAGFVVVMETYHSPTQLVGSAEAIYENHILSSIRKAGLTVDEKGKRGLSEAIKATKFLLLDTADRGTLGPIEMCITGYAAALTVDPSPIYSIVFQAELTKRGAQLAGAAGEAYLAYFDTPVLVDSSSLLQDIIIRNKSDDPWKPKRILIFSLGARRTSSSKSCSRLLARIENNDGWLSQNPHVTSGITASQSIRLFANYRTILD